MPTFALNHMTAPALRLDAFFALAVSLGTSAVEIRTDWFNRTSQRAIERLGAKRDGVLRSHQMLDGRVRDLVVNSIIACEWPGVRVNLEHLLARHQA